MKDTADSAVKLATEFFEKGSFTATRWCPGDMPGEWMVVDDVRQELLVVQLNNKEFEQVLDGYEYESGVERYNNALDRWMVA